MTEQNQKSEVEKCYAAMAAKFNYNRAWHELHPLEQHQFVQGINLILSVFE